MDTPASTQDVNKILRILKKASNTTQLKFKVYKLTVTPNIFHRVAMAIKQGKIQIVYESRKEYATGAYNNITNKLSFNKNKVNLDDLFGQAFIVHEAVHASHDVDKLGYIDVVDGETAAYIAQAIYANVYLPRGKSISYNNIVHQKHFKKVIMASDHAARHIISGKIPRNGDTPLADDITVIQYQLKASKMYCKRVNRTHNFTGV